MTNYQIVQGSPVYCPIRDGIIGSQYRILPMTYFRGDYAYALAGRMGRENYRDCGDDWFYVIRAGETALTEWGRENRAAVNYTFRDADGNEFDTGIDLDDMPF